jgi:hypothetical protein
VDDALLAFTLDFDGQGDWSGLGWHGLHLGREEWKPSGSRHCVSETPQKGRRNFGSLCCWPTWGSTTVRAGGQNWSAALAVYPPCKFLVTTRPELTRF